MIEENMSRIDFFKGMTYIIKLFELDKNEVFPYEICKQLTLDEINSLMWDFFQYMKKGNKK